MQEEPGGLLSDGASAHLPAAAIPAILSIFVDASSLRLWRAAPAVRPEMSSLDLERSWHLKDRVGIDVCLGTLQVVALQYERCTKKEGMPYLVKMCVQCGFDYCCMMTVYGM